MQDATYTRPSWTFTPNDYNPWQQTQVHAQHKVKKHSKVVNSRSKELLHLTIPKRNYSVARVDSLRRYKISVIDEAYLARQKSTPSSVQTVFTVACLFVVALVVLISGIIILCQHQSYAFDIFGYGFLAVGLITLCLCAILQRKNICKLLQDLNKDVYFSYTNQ